MRDLAATKKILGIKIHRSRSAQMKYIEKMLKRFGMLDAKPVKNPLAAHY